MIANQVVNPFGYQARRTCTGYFLSPMTGGDDAMWVDDQGEITVYVEDAQAFLAAKALQAAIRQVREPVLRLHGGPDWERRDAAKAGSKLPPFSYRGRTT